MASSKTIGNLSKVMNLNQIFIKLHKSPVRRVLLEAEK